MEVELLLNNIAFIAAKLIFCSQLLAVCSVLICCSAKIVIHLHPAPANKEQGPYQHSKFSFIKLSFKEHGQIEVKSIPHQAVAIKWLWIVT